MDKEQKDFIDNASYLTLLKRWRFSKVGDEIFQGEAGEYYGKVMAKRRDEDPAAAVRASKELGFKP